MRSITRATVLARWVCSGLAVALTACGGPQSDEVQSQGAALSAQAGSGEAQASVALASAENKDLLARAREFLNNRNQNLIAGGVITAEAPSAVSAAMSNRITSDNAALRERVAQYAGFGERYTAFSTDVRLVSAKKVKGKLVARVEESTRLDYAKVSGDEPPFTAYQAEREFVYSKDRSGGWILEEVKLVGGGLAPVNEVVTADVGENALVESPIPPSDAPIDSSPLRTRGSAEKAGRGEVGALAYNYAAMAAYAQRYALSPNWAYRYYFWADCTNFVSQAMYAGGWTYVGGDRTSLDAWWYTPGVFGTQSYTWSGAANWFWFARRSGRASYVASVWYMWLGDVLQMDFTRDGSIDHTMIITVAGSNDLYLSYHTTNTLNRSLRSIIAQYPNAWYYGHRT